LTLLDATYKGFPGHLSPVELSCVGQQGWSLLEGHLSLPLAILKQSAIDHNLAWMQRFCKSKYLDIAPHGKTSMSPELFHRQLNAGAWGISFANVFQAGLGIRHGVPRIIIANQVFQHADLDTLAALLQEHPSVTVYFLVDDMAQLDALDAWRASRNSKVPLTVLIELGIAGKRTGCRDAAQALALARRIKATPRISLCGVECYEGALATCNHDHDKAAVAELMTRVQSFAQACEAEDLFECDEILLTAGGSAIFDLVAVHLLPLLKKSARGILRSGCYLTHDHVHYKQMLMCVGQRLQLRETLKPALEVLSRVQSCPEPGLSLLSMGKRDVSFDLDLPVPLWRASVGHQSTRPVPAHWQITALNDQHAYLHFDAHAPDEEKPFVGQIVGSGISHPCTTFDKWRWMPLVDDHYKVIDAVSIHF
jgi:D-serine dehydratase